MNSIRQLEGLTTLTTFHTRAPSTSIRVPSRENIMVTLKTTPRGELNIQFTTLRYQVRVQN